MLLIGWSMAGLPLIMRHSLLITFRRELARDASELTAYYSLFWNLLMNAGISVGSPLLVMFTLGKLRLLPGEEIIVFIWLYVAIVYVFFKLRARHLMWRIEEEYFQFETYESNKMSARAV